MIDTVEATASAAARPGRAGKPLFLIRGVMSVLDINEDKVLQLIEDGSLPWAWDFSLEPARCRKRELRVLPAAVADYMLHRSCVLEWPDVLSLIVPAAPELTTNEITQALNISQAHLFALARRGAIQTCSKWRRGPGGMAHFTRPSLVQFLKTRRF